MTVIMTSTVGSDSAFLVAQPRPNPAQPGFPGSGKLGQAQAVPPWQRGGAHEDPALTHWELAEFGARVGVREGSWLCKVTFSQCLSQTCPHTSYF